MTGKLSGNCIYNLSQLQLVYYDYTKARPLVNGKLNYLKMCDIISVISLLNILWFQLYSSSCGSIVVITCLDLALGFVFTLLKRAERGIFLLTGPLHEHEHVARWLQVPRSTMISWIEEIGFLTIQIAGKHGF